VSPGDCATRLGHSVETLHRHYVGVLSGDVAANNARIAAFLAAAESPEVTLPRLVAVKGSGEGSAKRGVRPRRTG